MDLCTQATYLPLWMTQHLSGFSNLVALKIRAGLPYLNPWQLAGNGMDAFRLAKEATLKALDAPITGGTAARSGDHVNGASPKLVAGKGRIGLVVARTRIGERGRLHSKL
ncbi:unnamed protein product [Sphacelaria rigidula]